MSAVGTLGQGMQGLPSTPSEVESLREEPHDLAYILNI